MKNTFKETQKELTTTEFIIGVFSFIIVGVGFIFIVLKVWQFIDAIFG